MILGPFVQKFAFGEYWTGFPWGYDLTDNKTLIMWVAWILAVLVLGGKTRKIGAMARLAVLIAAFVMTVVYLIPHSMRGSELNYEAMDSGVSAEEAVGTSDE
jgi:amino acid permease